MGCGSSSQQPDSTAQASSATTMVNPADPEAYKQVHSTIRWNKLAELNSMVSSAAIANLQDKDNGNCCIHIAAQNGHFDVVKLLVKKGADVNAQNAGGQTALHMVVSYEINDVLDFLMANGANPNLKNNDGFEAKFGLSGEKDPSSPAGMMAAFEGAESTAALIQALDNLDASDSSTIDKATFVQKGLKKKKASAGMWTPEVNGKFTGLMQKI